MKKLSILILLFVSFTTLVGCNMVKMDNEFVSYCTEYPEAPICTNEQVTKESQIKELLKTYQNAKTEEERIEFCQAFINSKNTELLASCETGDEDFLPDDFDELLNQFTVVESEDGTTIIEVTNTNDEGYLVDLDMTIDSDGFIQINSITYSEKESETPEITNAQFESIIIEMLNDVVNYEVEGNEIVATYLRSGYDEQELIDDYNSWNLDYYSLQYVRFVEYWNGYYILDIGYTWWNSSNGINVLDEQITEKRFSAQNIGGDIKLFPLPFGTTHFPFNPELEEGEDFLLEVANELDPQDPDCYKYLSLHNMYYHYPDQSPAEACGEEKQNIGIDTEVISVELEKVNSDPGWPYGYLATFEYVNPDGGDNLTLTRYVVFDMSIYGLTVNTIATYEWYLEFVPH